VFDGECQENTVWMLNSTTGLE